MRMVGNDEPIRLHSTVIERLTVDAMVLADEVESYFGTNEIEEAIARLDLEEQAQLARAGLRLSRLANHLVEVVARYDGRDAVVRVEIEEHSWMREDYERLPPRARALVEATCGLLDRIEGIRSPKGLTPGPARALQAFLAEQLGMKLG